MDFFVPTLDFFFYLDWSECQWLKTEGRLRFSKHDSEVVCGWFQRALIIMRIVCGGSSNRTPKYLLRSAAAVKQVDRWTKDCLMTGWMHYIFPIRKSCLGLDIAMDLGFVPSIWGTTERKSNVVYLSTSWPDFLDNFWTNGIMKQTACSNYPAISLTSNR